MDVIKIRQKIHCASFWMYYSEYASVSVSCVFFCEVVKTLLLQVLREEEEERVDRQAQSAATVRASINQKSINRSSTAKKWERSSCINQKEWRQYATTETTVRVQPTLCWQQWWWWMMIRESIVGLVFSCVSLAIVHKGSNGFVVVTMKE